MSFSENAILTRARAIYSNRMTDQNYRDLLNCSSVSDAAEYLSSQTQYFNTFSSVTSAKINRVMLESLLKRNYVAQFSSLYKFSKIIGNELCKFFVILNEITVILSCMRYVLAPNKLDIFISVPTFDDMEAGFDLLALASSENFDEMLTKLEKTPYYDLLKEFSGKTPDILKVENKLYGFLYEKTEEIAKKTLSKSEYKEVYEILAVYSDLKFITNVYRLKSIFKFTPEKIRYYGFAQSVTLLTKKEAQELISAQDDEDFLKILSRTVYKKGLTGEEKENTEHWARDYQYKFFSKRIMYSTNPNTVMLCCFFLKENEIKNITHIIEGIKYAIEPNEIQKYLVGFTGTKEGVA